MVPVGAHRPVERPEDPPGVVVGALDVERGAVATEPDGGLALEGAQVADARRVVVGRLEPEPAGEGDRSEDEVLGQLDRGVEGRGAVGSERLRDQSGWSTVMR